ncbi:MAG: polysaccharide biosynthesis protein [Clostridiales bacterium]|nr:polysaccharide biosynthesis protein [Clostridiales bacterium]
MTLYDGIAVNVAYFFALLLRHEMRFSLIDEVYVQTWLEFTPIYTIFCIILFWALHLYQSMWRFASYYELAMTTIACGISAAFHITMIALFYERMPISYYVMGAFFQYLLILGIRFSYRFYLTTLPTSIRRQDKEAPRILLVGAGNAGQTILRDLHKAKELNGRVLAIIDDNPNKWSRYIDGVPIVGGRDDIPRAVEKYKIDKIYVCIPSASETERRKILRICRDTGCELKNLPGIYQIVNGDISISALREVAIEDLLGRDPIASDLTEVFRFLQDKVILVTGGGGSIGSELCRQIAAHSPRRLIIFDVYENNAYDIEQELRRTRPQVPLTVIIGSVRDSGRLKDLFETWRPDIVFHAAAHKHVPLMEVSPCEAIKNNAIGTYKTAMAAMRAGVSRFILISTDKAVNPANIMGASKRIAEMVIQTFDYMTRVGRERELPLLHGHRGNPDEPLPESFHGRTRFVAVRFGNVLGSNGSVIPLFRRQIEAGGPVTVTHPDIIRYFMTIPEAVGLVLQASVMAEGSEIFVLDMGQPVKIDDLARNLIRLSGFVPDRDIRIVYTGLRPGEKLYEEKLMAEEGLQRTDNNLIHIGKPVDFDHDEFLRQLSLLMEEAFRNDEEAVRTRVAEIVPTYHPAENSLPETNAESGKPQHV